MKLVKMSLAAAVLLGASAFAIDNVKVSGDAKVYYSTTEGGDLDLFDKDASMADTALRIGVTGDLLKGVSFGATAYAVSTLGLENNLVSNTWTGAHGVTTGNGSSFDPLGTNGLQVDDAAWMGELWMAATMGKTTAKVGRMELDTPLAYSEKWSIVPNTFDAAVLINQDLPDTTLVAAWVGKGNGVNAVGTYYNEIANRILRPTDGVANGNDPYGDPDYDYAALNRGAMNATLIGDNIVGAGAKFNTFMNKGAYAVGAINNSFKPLTAQAWYYNIGNIADAYWLQADINCQLVKGLTIGAQYAELSPKAGLEADLKAIDATLGTTNFSDDTQGYAFKLGYSVDALTVSAAYSKVDDQGILQLANSATNHLDGADSKLYTETFWNRGWVGAPDSKSWNVKGSYDLKNVAKFCASYTNVDNDAWDDELKEFMVGASKSFGPLDAKLAYISTDIDSDDERTDTLNVYLTLNF